MSSESLTANEPLVRECTGHTCNGEMKGAQTVLTMHDKTQIRYILWTCAKCGKVER